MEQDEASSKMKGLIIKQSVPWSCPFDQFGALEKESCNETTEESFSWEGLCEIFALDPRW